MVVPISQYVSMYSLIYYEPTITPGSVHYSLINIDCRSKVILLFKLQILSRDPDRIPLTYVSVTFTDYRSAFSPTTNVATRQQPLLAPCSSRPRCRQNSRCNRSPRIKHTTQSNVTARSKPMPQLLQFWIRNLMLKKQDHRPWRTQSEHVVRQNCCFSNWKIPMALAAQYIFGNVASSRNPTFSDHMTWRQTPQPVDPTIEDMFRVSWTKPTHRGWAANFNNYASRR